MRGRTGSSGISPDTGRGQTGYVDSLPGPQIVSFCHNGVGSRIRYLLSISWDKMGNKRQILYFHRPRHFQKCTRCTSQASERPRLPSRPCCVYRAPCKVQLYGSRLGSEEVFLAVQVVLVGKGKEGHLGMRRGCIRVRVSKPDRLAGLPSVSEFGPVRIQAKTGYPSIQSDMSRRSMLWKAFSMSSFARYRI